MYAGWSRPVSGYTVNLFQLADKRFPIFGKKGVSFAMCTRSSIHFEFHFSVDPRAFLLFTVFGDEGDVAPLTSAGTSMTWKKLKERGRQREAPASPSHLHKKVLSMHTEQRHKFETKKKHSRNGAHCAVTTIAEDEAPHSQKERHQASDRPLLPYPCSSLTKLLSSLPQPFHGERVSQIFQCTANTTRPRFENRRILSCE